MEQGKASGCQWDPNQSFSQHCAAAVRLLHIAHSRADYYVIPMEKKGGPQCKLSPARTYCCEAWRSEVQLPSHLPLLQQPLIPLTILSSFPNPLNISWPGDALCPGCFLLGEAWAQPCSLHPTQLRSLIRARSLQSGRGRAGHPGAVTSARHIHAPCRWQKAAAVT